MTSADIAANEVKGNCSARFQKVRNALANKLASSDKLGASIVININGEIVANM